MELQEDDIILCTVKRIEPTSVFVDLPNGKEGTIITSEIAPGRIRNLREYVVPKKKIVCKILRVTGNHIELSLRRVNSKERKEVMQNYKQEKQAESAINQILKQESENVKEKILKEFPSLLEFLTQAKEKESLIEDYIPKEFHEQIKKITQKKQKEIEIKKILHLKCLEENGLERIKNILNIKDKNVRITYISAGKFQINLKGENYKEINHKLDPILEQIEKEAKQNSCEFSIKEK